MNKRFDAIAIFGAMRSGSNLLERSLGLHPKVKIFGEIFNPNFIGDITQESSMGYAIAERDHDPIAFLDTVCEHANPRLPCFRIFQDHNKQAQDAILKNPRIAKVILRRNAVDSFTSLLIARETDQWLLARKKMASVEAKVEFNKDEFTEYAQSLDLFYEHISTTLSETGQDSILVNYSEIKSLSKLNEIFSFAEIHPPLIRYDEPIRRQNPHPAAYYLTNPDVLDQIRYIPEPSPEAEAQPPALDHVLFAKHLKLGLLNIEATRDAHERFHLRKSNGADLETLTYIDIEHMKGPRDFQIYVRPAHPVVRLYRLYHLAALEPVAFCGDEDIAQHLHEYVSKEYGANLATAFDASTPLNRHKQFFKKFLFFVRDGLWKNSEIRVRPAFLPQSMIIEEWERLTNVHVLTFDDQIGEFPAPPRRHIPSKFPLGNIVDGTIIERSKAIYADDYYRFHFADSLEGFCADYP